MANYLPANPDTSNHDQVREIHDALIFIGVVFDTKSPDYIDKVYGEYSREVVQKFEEENGLKYENSGWFNQITGNLINAKMYNLKATSPEVIIELFEILKRSGFNVSRSVLAKGQIDLPMTETIRAFQHRMFLPGTGYPDKRTEKAIRSFTNRTFPEYLQYKPTASLKRITHNLDFSSTGKQVRRLHISLAALGYMIEMPEYNSTYYGKSTIEAVKMLQRASKIGIDGRMNTRTAAVLSAALDNKIPGIVDKQTTYRVRGTIRDEQFSPIPNCIVEVFHNKFLEKPILLGTRETFKDGFFDIIYTPYLDNEGNVDIKNNSLTIKVITRDKEKITQQVLFNVKPVHYFNFTKGHSRKTYLGKDLYRILTGKLLYIRDSRTEDDHILGWFTKLREDHTEGLTILSKKTEIEINTLMKLYLAFGISHRLNGEQSQVPGIQNLSPAIIFALIFAGNTILPENILPDRGDDWDQWRGDMEMLIIRNMVLLDSENLIDILQAALRDHIVGITYEPFFADLANHTIPEIGEFVLLDQPLNIQTGVTLGTLFDNAKVAAVNKPQLSKIFIESQGFTDNFWQGASAVLPPATYEDLYINTEYGSLVSYDSHNTMIITSKLIDNKFDNAYKIAGLSREEWRDIILNQGMHIPNYPVGEEPPVDRFANDLYQKTTQLFPSLSFVSNLKDSGSSGLPELKTIQDLLKARPKFNLLSEDLDPFFTEISASEELKEQILLVQRIQNYTPYSTEGSLLLQNKFHSAAQIVNFKRDTFIAKMNVVGMERDTAAGIFRQAEYNYAKLLSFFSEFSPQTNQTSLAVLPNNSLQPEQNGMAMRNFNTLSSIPDLENLFGSLDSCACGECQSVVGASAYLVDLMRFLESRIAKPSDPLATQTVKEVLLARRPDLNYIELSCVNTDTPVPYIDIVCEVLENAVAYIDTFPNPAPDPQLAYNHQTRLSAKELRAFPEYLNKNAYNRLLGELYPVSSPIFNLWQETTRLYLAHLGSPWWKLMQVWQRQTSSGFGIPSDPTIGAEYFEFSSLEAGIIEGYSDINQTKVLLSNVWNIDFFGTLPTTVAVDWFLQKTKLSYEELLVFLQTDYIQVTPPEERMIIISPLGNNDPCDTGVQQIANLSFDRYDRIQRFLRLWRHTGWTMWEVDMLLGNSVTAPTIETDDPINGLTLYHLMQFSEMQKQLKLDADELLSFWGNINSKNYRIVDGEIKSLYPRLFLNLSFVNPIADDFYDLAYHPEVEPTPPNFTGERIKFLSAALVYPETEVRKILAYYAEPDSGAAEDAPFTLEAIAFVYRHITILQKLKIKYDEFLAYTIIIQNGYTFSNIATVGKAIQEIQFMRSVDKDSTVWQYILNTAPDNPNMLEPDRLERMLQELRIAITVAVSELEAISNPERPNSEQASLLFQRLPQFQNQGQVQLAIDFVEGRSISSPPVFPDPSNTRRDFFDEFFSPFIPRSEREAAFGFFAQSAVPLPEPDIAARYNYLFFHLRNYAIQLSYSQIISRQLGVDLDLLDVLLQDVLITAQWQDMSLIAVLFDSETDFIAKDSNGAYVYPIIDPRFDYTRTVYNLLHKIAALLDFLPELSSEDLSRYIAYQKQLDQNYPGSPPPVVGITNLSTLLTVPAYLPESYTRLANWIKLEQIRAGLGDKTDEFFELLNDAIALTTIPTVEIAGLLGSIFDEPVETMVAVLTHLNLNRRHFTNAAFWSRIQACIDNYSDLGVNVASIVSWLNKTNDPVTGEIISNDVVKASKAKYSLDTWLTVIEPFQDTLREKKRDALVSFLVEYSLRHNNPTVPYPAPPPPAPVYANSLYWTNSNDLYAYFLLDVEMSPCQLTSRIRQASLSVQVFVQRCFLGLEKLHVEVPNVNAGPDDMNNWNQWQWMKYYRIWDASRRIFLYPENWIEPDLRPDMSPFFRELTDELSQGDVTDERAEEVLYNYLDKIQEVANLDIASVYHEREPGIDVFHVLGRTKANPFNYYYRTFNQLTRLWTAWDKITADITGSHPLLTKYNGKVYLFWLLFEEKTDKLKKIPAAKMTTAPQDAPDAPKMFEIKLSWIRRRSDGWTEKRVSNEKMIHPWGRPKYSYNLRPRLKPLDNTLWIDLYISTSAEFNQPVSFYNQKTGTFDAIAKAQFNESFRPWHSSSFVFDGAVRELRLRKMYGNFLAFSGSNSYDYVNRNFEEAGRAIKQLSSDIQSKINLPWGMHFEYTYLTNNIRNNVNTLKFDTLEYGMFNRSLLRKASPPFKMAVSLQDAQINKGLSRPFFYQDPVRSFFIRPHLVPIIPGSDINNDGLPVAVHYNYDFNNFYHPYAQVFIQELNKSGLLGLYNRRLQTAPGSAEFYPGNTFEFNTTYDPNLDIVNVTENAQTDKVDFSYSGAYSIYNWELFFHVPFFIANKLSQNQRFEEAMKWYQYIFNPTSSENYPEPKRFWITKPFFEMADSDYTNSRINAILSNISAYTGQVNAWRNDPHNPHLVALGRPVAYQKAIVMKFIDNLLAWGDYLFRADTMETVQEASTLYLLAYQILGKKPEKVPGLEGQHLTVKEIFDPGNEIDEFGGASVTLENYLIDYTGGPNYENPELPIRYTGIVPNLMLQYFCIPDNPKLISYWALVEDRLFKLRHCMNIDGIVRQLPLFEPPIDPALLVRARAQGLSIASVLFNMNTPAPNYRFRTILQKAMEYCAEVKSLGERLLSIIERLDSENLSVLRSTHEINLMDLLTESKELQIDELDENIANLEKALEITEAKMEYYRSIPKINAEEKMAETLQNTAMGQDIKSGVLSTLAGTMVLIPSISAGLAGAGGSPTFSSTLTSGTALAGALNAAATAIQISSGINKTRSSMLLTKGGYTRRDEENKFQVQQAEREIQQINIQLTAAQIRKQIAEKDLRDHTTRIEYSQVELDFMKSKFTNAALYNWMLSQITSTYFQAYQFAHDMALKAEACYKFELGIQNTSFIDYGYWDNLRKGLLAGDKLGQSLRRLEVSYFDQNKRELEITKSISLAQYFPTEFTTLKATGQCNINLDEWVYDLDYPGQYKRRIKSVSVTIPCVTGPYTSVNCRLSMSSSTIRSTKDRQDVDNMYTEYAAQNQIVTSSAQGDSGMFQINLGDERFLPFEGAGAISQWEILLPQDSNQFDFSTLTDFIIHIQYTAMEGDAAARQAAIDILDDTVLQDSVLLLNLRQMFAAEWYKILAPENTGNNVMSLKISNELFPFFFRNKDLKFRFLDLYIDADDVPLTIQSDTPHGSLPPTVSWQYIDEQGPLKRYRLGSMDTPLSLPGDDDKGTWTLKVTTSPPAGTPLTGEQLRNAYLIINFTKN